MKSLLTTLIAIVFFTQLTFPQMTLNRDYSLFFEENGVQFTSALSGGIDAGQFSNLDLNLDGIMDIVIFDKSGNKLSPFINNNGTFIYTPEYREKFPAMHDWALLEDYNCDGKNDIFTYSSSGMSVYLNTSDTELEFTQTAYVVMSNYSGQNFNLYLTPASVPAIADIDYDGDLDILCFGQLSGSVEYHKNLSKELYGTCDSLVFERSERCWGLFYDASNSIILNCPNCICAKMDNSIKEKDGTPTLLAIDIDNDNDMDLILGDGLGKNLNLLINGGDNQNAFITSIDTIFPRNHNNTIGVEIDFNPAAYYVDVTNDGINDLIATTNKKNSSANFESCWLYENNGQNNLPNFNFIKKDFLQAEMIEIGSSAYPTFYDYNNDGLEDLIIGNHGYHNPNEPNPISCLALFENTGNDSIPKYKLITRDWIGLSNINLNTILTIPADNLSPTFGDLNGDNNKDLIIGDSDGKLHLFNNTGSGNFQLSAANYLNIDVGRFAHPQLIDVNRDGLTDLIIGAQDGTINFLPNSGSTSNAIFDTIIENWGGIDIDEDFISSFGLARPILYDSNGVYQLFVGSYTGSIYQFTNIDNNLTGQFTAVNSTASTLWDGGRSAIAMADINDDNQADMIIGNLAGGIGYFSSDSLMTDTLTVITNDIKEKIFSIFPNPTKKNFSIVSINNGIVKIYNLLGVPFYTTIKKEYELKINTSNLSKGVYIVELNKSIQKLIIE